MEMMLKKKKFVFGRLFFWAVFFISIIIGFGGSVQGKALFTFLDHNSKHYRTFDSTSTIQIPAGELLFSWKLVDADSAVDSFYIGIDSLFSLPADIGEDTANDWDLQVCPDGFCILGLKLAEQCVCTAGSDLSETVCPLGFCSESGVKSSGFGGNSNVSFGGFLFASDQHFQFVGAFDENFKYTAPANTIFGGMMYARSRSTGVADTVFAFGAWGLEWDENFPPPLRPVEGYLPKVTDFVIKEGKVQFIRDGASVLTVGRAAFGGQMNFFPHPFSNSGINFRWDAGSGLGQAGHALIEGEIFNTAGRRVYRFGMRPNEVVTWKGRDEQGRQAARGVYLVRWSAVGLNFSARILKF